MGVFIGVFWFSFVFSDREEEVEGGGICRKRSKGDGAD